MATLLNEPSVCAIMLTRDRPEMARRAVACFRRQSYQNKVLRCWDTGYGPFQIERAANETFCLPAYPDGGAYPIGDLRNDALIGVSADIIVHLDDDDFSHTNRIAEQVALLQSSGADCVGYNEMLFWRGQMVPGPPYPPVCPSCHLTPCFCSNQAWLYSNPNPSYVLGASMCYWRKAWEARPFEATSQGEDVRWCAGVRCLGVRSIGPYRVHMGNDQDWEPRMIARIHAGNTSNAYRPETMARASEWRRVSEWDQHCRSVFA